MKQERRNTIVRLMDGADNAVNGATLHPELVPINNAAAITDDSDAMVAKRDGYENAKALLGTQRDALAGLKESSRISLVIGRDLLKKDFGHRYRQAWDSTGLTGTLKISTQLEKVKSLLASFKAHFTANPTQENAPLGVTALNYGTLRTDLVAAENLVINQTTALKTAKNERDAAVRAMDKRLINLFGELKQKLDPLDPRWLAFGFKLPGLKLTPPTPGKVTIAVASDSALTVKWDQVPRAEYYRIWAKVNGVDETMLVKGTSAELSFTLENLPSATEVEVAISAVNNGGESALSEITKVTTE